MRTSSLQEIGISVCHASYKWARCVASAPVTGSAGRASGTARLVDDGAADHPDPSGAEPLAAPSLPFIVSHPAPFLSPVSMDLRQTAPMPGGRGCEVRQFHRPRPRSRHPPPPVPQPLAPAPTPAPTPAAPTETPPPPRSSSVAAAALATTAVMESAAAHHTRLQLEAALKAENRARREAEDRIRALEAGFCCGSYGSSP